MRQIVLGCVISVLAPASLADFAAPFLEELKTARPDSSGGLESSASDEYLGDRYSQLVGQDGWRGTSLAFEHSVRALPNVRLHHYQHGRLAVGANGPWQSIDFGPSFDASGVREASVDQLDATLYYEVMDSFVNVDLGVNLKRIDASVQFNDVQGRERLSYTATFPMLYANALFHLPFQGFSAGIEGSMLDYERNRLSDYRAKLSYEWRSRFGMEGGWRSQQYLLDEADGISPNLELQGPFLDLYYRF